MRAHVWWMWDGHKSSGTPAIEMQGFDSPPPESGLALALVCNERNVARVMLLAFPGALLWSQGAPATLQET